MKTNLKFDKIGLALFVILLLGFFLRIHNLGQESLWLDEGWVIRQASLGFSQMTNEFTYDEHPPLYQIILHYWINLFSNSEFSTRLLSVIFGFFSIFMMYKVGSLIFNRHVGLLSSLLLSLSVFHINYSREVKSYSLMAFLTLVSFYFLIMLLRKRNLSVSICYTLSSVLLLYTHIYGMFIILAQNIYLITAYLFSKETYGQDFKKWVLLQVVVLTLFLPWLIILILRILRMEQVGYVVPPPSLNLILNSFSVYSNFSSLLFLIFMFFLASFSLISYKNSKGGVNWDNILGAIKKRRFNISFSDLNKIYLLLLWLFVPIFLPFIISLFSIPIYRIRYTIGAFLAFYLLIAKGITNINNRYLKTAVICVILIFSLISIHGYKKFDREQWRDVAYYVDSNIKQEDLLLFSAKNLLVLNQYPSSLQYTFDYYSKKTSSIDKLFIERIINSDVETMGDFEPPAIPHKRIWLVCRNTKSESFYNLFKEKFNKHYNLSYYKRYEGIELFLFIKKN